MLRDDETERMIAYLKELDEPLCEALTQRQICLIDADVLRNDQLDAMKRRQDLEKMEADKRERIFLPPEEAVKLLKSSTRCVGALTYGWTTPKDPDVTREYLRHVKRFLRSTHGKYIKGLFWDFGSLPQWPRSAAEDALFYAALNVMGDLYASPLGTTVLRHKTVPRRPADFDGKLIVKSSAPPGKEHPMLASEAALHAALTPLVAHGGRGRVLQVEAREEARGGSVELTFEVSLAGHDDPTSVALQLEKQADGRVAAFPAYTERAYEARGWPTFESAVSAEAMARVAYVDSLNKLLQPPKMPPKIMEIDFDDDEAHPAQEIQRGGVDAKARLEKVEAAIQRAFFTARGDRDRVSDIFNNYVIKINNAMRNPVLGEYRGSKNAHGQKDGRGVMSFANGNVYDGEWKADGKHGKGKMTYFNGDIFDGEFEENAPTRGTYHYGNGDVYTGDMREADNNLLAQGNGKITFSNGKTYEGQWHDGFMHGYGEFRNKKGEIKFKGTFVHNEPEKPAEKGASSSTSKKRDKSK